MQQALSRYCLNLQAAQLAADADALLEPEEAPDSCLPRILSSKDTHVRQTFIFDLDCGIPMDHICVSDTP